MYAVHTITILLKKRITVVQKYNLHHEFHRNTGEIVVAEFSAASVPHCSAVLRYESPKHINTSRTAEP